jgi:hypothetical protein
VIFVRNTRPNYLQLNSASFRAALHERSYLPSNESGVPQMVIRRPLNVLELPDQLGLQPPAFLHLLGGQALSPPTTFGLRKVHEGAIG